MIRISIDNLDLNIIDKINSLRSKEDVITTYTIAKDLFKCNTPYELKRKDNFVRERLKKLSLYNLIEIVDNGYKNFFLLCKNVERKNWRVFKHIQDSYFLRINGKWHVFPYSKM